MKTSKTGVALIKHFEGLRLTAYRDSVGIWTIGHGHTKGVKEGMIITETKADELLKKDLEYFEDCVMTMVNVEVTQNQFDALTSFTFNLGEGALYKSTLLKKLNANKPLEAADEFLKWDKARNPKTGKLEPLSGLTKRRKAERLLFLTELKLQDILDEISRLAKPKPPEIVE